LELLLERTFRAAADAPMIGTFFNRSCPQPDQTMSNPQIQPSRVSSMTIMKHPLKSFHKSGNRGSTLTRAGGILAMLAAFLFWGGTARAQTDQLLFSFNDAVPSVTTTDSIAGVVLTMTNHLGVTADLHGAIGTGVSGHGRSLDLTSDDGANTANATGSTASAVVADVNDARANLGTVNTFVTTFWFKNVVRSGSGDSPILFVMGPGSATESSLVVQTANTIGFAQNTSGNPEFWGGTTLITNPTLTSGNMTTNQWLFYALTYDGSNYRIYAGTETNTAVLVNTVAATGSLAFGSTSTILLGNRGSLNRNFMGWIDDFDFFNGNGSYTGTSISNFVEEVRQTSTGPLVTAATGAGNVALNWFGLGAPTTSYNVYRSTVNGGPYTMISTPATVTGTNYTDSTVSNGLTYYYVVTSVTPYGESAYSYQVSGTPGIPVVSATVISPTNNPVYAGSVMTLSASVAGTSPLVPTYAWQTDGGSGGVTWTTLSGSTTNFYVLSTASLTPATYQYRLVVTDAAGTTTNASASLSVVAASGPVVSANTALTPAYVPLGGSSVASATFNGTLPIYYQWLFNSGSGAVAIAGATNNTLSLTNLQYASSGSYSLVASNNPAGVPTVLTSTPAVLTVTVPVVLSDLGATAPVPGTYDISQLSTSGDIQSPDGFNYYDNNGTPCGESFTTGSNPTGYLLSALYIEFGTVNGGHSAGGTYTLRLYSLSGSTAGSTATLLSTYVNNNTAPATALADWIEWSGGLTNVLQPNTIYAYTLNASSGYESLGNASGHPYTGGQVVEIPAAGGAVTFGTNDFNGTFDAQLVPFGYPVIQAVNISPANATNNPVYQPTPVTLTVNATGGTPLTYSWLTDNGSGGATWTVLPNSNTNAYTLNTATLAANTYEFEAVVTNSLASATSGVVTLNLASPSAPVVVTNTIITPSVATVGNTIALRASFSGTPTIYYQWYFTNAGVVTGISGATSPTYAIASAQAANSGAYFLTASNYVGVSSSTPVALVVTQPGQTNLVSAGIVDAGAAAPTPQSYDISQLVSAIPSTVPGLNYYVNNSAPPGQTFTTGNNPPTAAGYPLTSLFIQEEQGTIGSAGGTAQSYTLCLYSVSGTNAALLTAYTSTNTLAITDGDWLQWAGLTNLLQPSTTYAFAIHNQYGLYGWWKLANDGGDDTDSYTNGQAALLPANGYGGIAYSSDPTIDAAFSIGLTPLSSPVIVQDTTINPANCYAGNPVTMQALLSGTLPIKYQWQFTSASGGATVNIPGATNTTYTIASVSAGNAGTYSLVASNNPGGVPATFASTPATLTLQAAPTNFVANFAYSTSGNTGYSGPGAFPSGTFWNTIANTTGGSLNALADDGATPLYIGFTSSRTYDFYNAAGIGLFSAYMLNQSTTPLPFGLNNLPAGVYNLYLYSCDGGYQKSQTIFTINGVTYDDVTTTGSTFMLTNNYCVFTNIVVTNGTINGTWVEGGAEAAFNGLQVQLAYSFANPTINIASEPSNAVVALGQPASFNVLAFGPPPLIYQWQANGSPIAGATNSSLNFATTTVAEGVPNYDVIVSNLSGMVVTSSVVNLTVRTSVNDLLWQAYNSPSWDLSSINWEDTNAFTAVAFEQGDNVMFDDSAYDYTPVLGQRLMPGSVTVNAVSPYDFQGPGYLSWTMSLNLLGTSYLTLETVNDYTGNTVLGPGTTLSLLHAGSIADSVNVYLASGSTLVVTGRTDKTFTVSPGQTLLGDGVFYVSGTVTNDGALAFKVNKTGGVISNDQLAGLTKITCGGTLQLDLSGQSLAAGDSFQLFSATNYAGGFSEITPATPGTGLAWNTNALTTSGTLSVVTGISSAPTSIVCAFSGNQLALSWPEDHTGWILQSQTNAPGVGLGTNWVEVAGSPSTNQATMTVNPADGSVYFRLVYP
jgi:hypothetical protein